MEPMETLISPFSRELRALFVEDDAASRVLIAAQLRGVFKELLFASNGQEGLEAFRIHAPQVVLTDDQMPLMSGIAMTEEIRKADPKVPIIFITASMDTALLVRAINLGISSFVPKPVALDNLRKSVALVVGLLENDHLQRKTLEQELALLQFRERYHEFQQELAFRKELSILENDFLHRRFEGVPGSGRGEWIAQVVYAPHDIMCGDSFSLRRLPDGSLLVYLADAMGKGLAASLTTSMSVSTFNLQVDALDAGEPFRFEAFVARYTALLRKRLLEDEVFSLCLAWLPAQGTALEAAVFGMPPLLLRGPGRTVRKLPSNNPPVSAYLEGFRTSSLDLEDTRGLLLYTDGLNEAVTADGSLYREHLDAAFLASSSREQLLDAFRAQVAAADDDVTFLLFSRVDAEPVWQRHLAIPSRLDQVERACQDIEAALEALPAQEPGAIQEFAAAIREALLNAYEHGSLEISAGLKRRLLEEGSYFEELLQREASVERLIQVDLALQAAGDSHLLKVTIQDEGPGFTPPASWFNEPDHLLVSGRGLKMVRKYTDAFQFNEKANAITLMKIYRGGSDAAGANGFE